MCVCVALGPFALLRLTSSNDSLMNGQEGTGRPTWLRRQLGSGCKVALFWQSATTHVNALRFHLNIKFGTSTLYNDLMVNLIYAINMVR